MSSLDAPPPVGIQMQKCYHNVEAVQINQIKCGHMSIFQEHSCHSSGPLTDSSSSTFFIIARSLHPPFAGFPSCHPFHPFPSPALVTFKLIALALNFSGPRLEIFPHAFPSVYAHGPFRYRAHARHRVPPQRGRQTQHRRQKADCVSLRNRQGGVGTPASSHFVL